MSKHFFRLKLPINSLMLLPLYALVLTTTTACAYTQEHNQEFELQACQITGCYPEGEDFLYTRMSIKSD